MTNSRIEGALISVLGQIHTATPGPAELGLGSAARQVLAPAPQRTAGVLALGTRDDARLFGESVARVGLELEVDIRAPEPSMADMVAFFGRSDQWLMLASHFYVGPPPRMTNESHDIDIEFYADRVVVKRGDVTETLEKGTGFMQHKSVELVLWGGCSVASDADTVNTMRSLFGPHLLIGWRGVTGWQILYSVMGGYGTQPPHASQSFFDRIDAGSTASEIGRAWLETGAVTQWGETDKDPLFSVIEPGGQEWIIENDRVVKGAVYP